MRVNVKSRVPINSTTSTITFHCLTQAKGIKRYYSEIDMIGKHFLVTSESNINVKRHYTICNCMKSEVYNEYLRVMKEFKENGKAGHF
jgi:hypothetical protein